MKGRIKINTESCKGCAYCVVACPLKVISIKKHFNKSGYTTAFAEHGERCSGCAVCATVCPEIAIEVFREKK
jgi:2-oxoglutarate ferredoxin oxidoreductase subunit delta